MEPTRNALIETAPAVLATAAAWPMTATGAQGDLGLGRGAELSGMDATLEVEHVYKASHGI